MRIAGMIALALLSVAVHATKPQKNYFGTWCGQVSNVQTWPTAGHGYAPGSIDGSTHMYFSRFAPEETSDHFREQIERTLWGVAPVSREAYDFLKKVKENERICCSGTFIQKHVHKPDGLGSGLILAFDVWYMDDSNSSSGDNSN